MKRHLTSNSLSRTWRGLLLIGLMAVLPAFMIVRAPVAASSPTPMQQQRRPWTAVGSSGVVDEDSLKLYAFDSADLTFKPGATGSVVIARYNVTNTFDNNANPNQPGWKTLEMGSKTPNSTIIEAKLFQIKACDTSPVLLCTARNRSNDNPCARCDINATIDFGSSLYYVEVSLNRFNSNTAQPRMFTLRLF